MNNNLLYAPPTSRQVKEVVDACVRLRLIKPDVPQQDLWDKVNGLLVDLELAVHDLDNMPNKEAFLRHFEECYGVFANALEQVRTKTVLDTVLTEIEVK